MKQSNPPIHLLHLLLLGLFMTTLGCADVPLDMRLDQPPKATTQVEGHLIRVKIDDAPVHIKDAPDLVSKYPFPVDIEPTVLMLWKNEIETACDSSGVFSGANQGLNLRVTVRKAEHNISYSHLRLTARYEITKDQSGAVIYSDEVVSEGSDSTFGGQERVNRCISSAVKANIRAFLDKFSTPPQS